jgi:hypothetical protein
MKFKRKSNKNCTYGNLRNVAVSADQFRKQNEGVILFYELLEE